MISHKHGNMMHINNVLFKTLGGLLILFAFIFLISCGTGQKGHPDEFVIKGSLKNSHGEKIMLQQLCIDSLSNMDSAIVDEQGTFSFREKADASGFYLLGTGKQNFIILLIDKGEDVEFTGDAMQLASDYRVKGSPGSQLLWELNSHTRNNYRISDSLYKIMTAGQTEANYDSVKRLVDSSFNKVFEEQREYVRTFIRKNDSSLASLIALYQVFGQQKVINEKEDIALYELLNHNLDAKYPGNAFVAELKQRVSKLKKEEKDRMLQEAKLDSGNMAPEIDLKALAGYNVKLSSLKGRTVLLYFWAGSSSLSQQVIPYYKYLNKTYGPKGFTIVGVSLDKDRQTWENAVRQNKISWTQVSDLQEWDSPLVRIYNITSLPVAFLIDKEGRILCKRPDNETLGKFLTRIYKF
jgi:peroxiredoxin